MKRLRAGCVPVQEEREPHPARILDLLKIDVQFATFVGDLVDGAGTLIVFC
ncbi:MAG TPA: hypothetical protein VML35_04235 [Gaiellaceae bacterium]|nr:hypothetical protein [Gaiellaceae bacterium]